MSIFELINCEHKYTNMFIFIIIYFSNVFENNHNFLFRCLHRNLVTSRTIIEKISNKISFNKYNTCLFFILIKIEEPQRNTWLFNFGLCFYIYIRLLLF